MKQEEVDKLFEEVRELLRLEKLIYESKMTQEDVTRLIALAEKGHPRAEYDYGLYFLVCLNDFESAYAWFQKCNGHARELILNKLATAYSLMKEDLLQENDD